MSLESFNAKLEATELKLRELKHFEALLDLQEKEKVEIEAELEALMEKKRASTQLQDDLDGLSLKNLFHSLTGEKEELRFQAKQDLLKFRLAQQQLEDSLSDARNELQRLRHEISKREIAPRTREHLLLEKAKWIADQQHPEAEELIKLTEQRAQLKAEQKEIQEALAAAFKVSGNLRKMLAQLDSAENWSTWDLLGGGLIVTALKHDRIGDARRLGTLVQTGLSALNRELSDVNIVTDLRIDIGQLTTFADFLFDDIFSEWSVASSISEAQGKAEKLKTSIQRVLTELKEREQTVATSLQQKDQQWRAFTRSAS